MDRRKQTFVRELSKFMNIITVTKNDNYLSIDKLIFTITENIKRLKSKYLLVDLCSDTPLYLNSEISFFGNKIHHLVVKPSVLNNNGLNPNIFYEYFAKNIGMRNSEENYSLLINSDIIVSDEFTNTINKFINDKTTNFCLRSNWRIDINYGESIKQQKYIEISRFDTMCGEGITGGYAGDIIFMDTDTFKKSRGYYEIDSQCRISKQTHLDRGYLKKLKTSNVNIISSDSCYHLYHNNRVNDLKGTDDHNYINNENWGFANSKREQIAENVTILT